MVEGGPEGIRYEKGGERRMGEEQRLQKRINQLREKLTEVRSPGSAAWSTLIGELEELTHTGDLYSEPIMKELVGNAYVQWKEQMGPEVLEREATVWSAQMPTITALLKRVQTDGTGLEALISALETLHEERCKTWTAAQREQEERLLDMLVVFEGLE